MKGLLYVLQVVQEFSGKGADKGADEDEEDLPAQHACQYTHDAADASRPCTARFLREIGRNEVIDDFDDDAGDGGGDEDGD